VKVEATSLNILIDVVSPFPHIRPNRRYQCLMPRQRPQTTLGSGTPRGSLNDAPGGPLRAKDVLTKEAKMEAQTRSADEMVRLVTTSPERLEALKANPLPELEKLKEEAKRAVPYVPTEDKLLYRIAIGVLGSLALIAGIGSVVLVIAGKTAPEALVSLGSASVGALVGLFAPSPTSR
jgi:hypothetical protein